MYTTAEGFGKLSVPQNQVEYKKENPVCIPIAENSDKENGFVDLSRKLSVVEMKKKEETLPIGPQKTKN